MGSVSTEIRSSQSLPLIVAFVVVVCAVVKACSSGVVQLAVPGIVSIVVSYRVGFNRCLDMLVLA